MSIRILIIEDDIATLSIYRQLFSGDEFAIEEAHDGENAIEVLARTAPDVVLLDLLLPKITGEALLDYIYSADHLRHTRVIIVSAAHRGSDLVLRNGDAFFLKPTRPFAIRDLVLQSALS